MLWGEQHVHPVIHGPGRDQIPDMAFSSLRNPMNAVLRLQIVIKAERAVEKYGVIRHCQRQSFFGGRGRCNQNPGFRVIPKDIKCGISVGEGPVSMDNNASGICKLPREPIGISR
jgi:hypothetical protein